MRDRERLEALARVKDYFRGKEVSDNTVLAAHMRAIGIAPSGDPWKVARAALQAGMSFEEAARMGGGHGSPTAPASASASVSRTTNAPPDHAKFTPATELTTARLNQGPLDWFPQRFEPGAIQGDGAKKLLGTPNVSLEDLLVRETAQNSWDARAGEESVRFTMNLRNLSDEVVGVLRHEVFTGDAPGTDLARSLVDEGVVAIEISDRGTTGLGGPVRNDKSVPEGEVTHFIDLVYNIGATKTGGTSGGTYGFGKSVAYMVSELGALVIWSRCQTSQGVEDRLIASAIGEVFDLDGYRHTGRHWWGRTIDGFPEPVVGNVAESLGRRLFSRAFEDQEFGTSILILAPMLGEPGPEDDADVLADSVLRNLWPKLVPDGSGSKPMTIRVQVDGTDHPIPDPASHPVYSGPVTCLQTVRAVQAGHPVPTSMFRCEVSEIRRYNSVVGHLALIKYPAVGLGDMAPSQAVTLMRSGAELVVTRLDRGPLTEAGFQWAGVFKPIPSLDPAFAKSEPPAHDHWSYESLSDKTQKSQVKVALDKVRAEADSFIQPAGISQPIGSTMSAAAIADGLSGFLGGVAGSGPSPRATSGGGGSRSRTARASLGHPIWQHIDRPGWKRTIVPIEIKGGDPAGSYVRAAVLVGTDGGSDRSEQPDFLLAGGWVGSDSRADYAFVSPESAVEYWFDSRDDVAVDFKVEVLSSEPT